MLYLASQSPRRQALLATLGVEFAVLAPELGVDMEALEAVRGQEAPLAYVKRVTLAKLLAAQAQLGAADAVLVADTTVAMGRHILGKPLTANANEQMLRRLQGHTHRVLTAVLLGIGAQRWLTVCTAHVQFAPLSDAQIQAYAASGEGWDKAGGYAIQGNAAAFVRHMRGNYTGIVGLPPYQTAQLLHAAQLLPNAGRSATANVMKPITP